MTEDTSAKHVPSQAALQLSAFLKRHMNAGTGKKDGKRWDGISFKEASGISTTRLSSLRTGMEEASVPNLSGIEKALFPLATGGKANPVYREWLHIKESFLDGPVPQQSVDAAHYSARDVWALLLNPIRANSTPIIREGGGGAIAPYFTKDEISFKVVPQRFILPAPAWFGQWARTESDGQYEVRDPVDFTGSPDLTDFYGQTPVVNLRELVAKHSEAYAREVKAKFDAVATFPPYNKEKLGLFAFQQPQPANRPERAYMAFWLYHTDYFTHRVMRRVLHEIRPTYPKLFEAKGAFFEEVGPFMRYFTTSFGLNLVVTTQEKSERVFHMVRLAGQQGNENQRRTLHVSANEGLNADDVAHDGVDLDAYTLRTLSEELGVTSTAPVESAVYMEFAMEMVNFEPYICGLVHLNMDGTTLTREKRSHARDDRRETTEMLPFAFSEQGIVDLLIDNPIGVRDFSSYALLILDSILARGLAGGK